MIKTLVLAAAGLAAAFAATQPASAFEIDRARGVLTLAPVLETATPAVVNIAVRGRRAARVNPMLEDPAFRKFFGMPEKDDGAPPPRPRRTLAAGSGVIVDARAGYVLTNHHVVDGAEEVEVTLSDGRTLDATVVGSDPGTDIAVLKVPARSLTALSFADSDSVRVGDFVMAIGNPFGLGQTVTSGIVSATGRAGVSPDRYEDFIQTDAAINPGNSGGALIDSRGRLVGVNSAILSRSGGNVGIGFAVPANMARAVMDQILRFGEVRRGRIGVRIQDLTRELLSGIGAPPTLRGALVAGVEDGSPADGAGIRSGDVVTAVDGAAVDGADDLRNRLGLRTRGDEVEITIWRRSGAERLRMRLTGA